MSNQDKWKNRIVGEGFIPANQLKGNPHNWRTHGEQQRKTMDGVLDEIGWIQRVIVNKTTGNIVDGHLRAEQALIKNERVPVLYIELTEDEEMLALATIDPISAMAGKDQEMVNSVIDSIQTQDESVLDLIQSLIDEPIKKEGLTDPDDVPEIEENPISKLGDVWLMGDHRLMCGSATSEKDIQKLMLSDIASITFTSPPYNAGKDINTGQSKYKNNKDNLGHDEYLNFLIKFTDIAIKYSEILITNIQMISGNKITFIDYLYKYKNKLVDIAIWDKGHAAPAVACNVFNSVFEFFIILTNEEKPKRTIKTAEFRGTIDNMHRGPPQRKNNYSDIHTATFPTHLPEWSLSLCKYNDVVLDVFGGTGTTLIACEMHKRQCRIMELEPLYVDVIIKRWQEFTGEKAIKEDGMLFNDLVNQHAY